MQFQVNISISDRGLQEIYSSGKSVALVQGTQDTPIIWLIFQPFQANQVIWSGLYSIYATGTALTPGNVVFMNSITDGPAQLGRLYNFQNGIFTATQGTAEGYSVANLTSSPDVLNFGLAQAANVNGVSVLSPLIATPVHFNQMASFTPSSAFSIFLTSYSNNGVIASQVPGNALQIRLEQGQTRVNVGFDDGSMSFTQLSVGTPLLSGAADDHPKISLDFARSLTAG